jgi:hypothetical protein
MSRNFKGLFDSYIKEKQKDLNELKKQGKNVKSQKQLRLKRTIVATQEFLEKHRKYHDVTGNSNCLEIIDKAINGIQKKNVGALEKSEKQKAQAIINALRQIKFNKLSQVSAKSRSTSPKPKKLIAKKTKNFEIVPYPGLYASRRNTSGQIGYRAKGANNKRKPAAAPVKQSMSASKSRSPVKTKRAKKTTKKTTAPTNNSKKSKSFWK